MGLVKSIGGLNNGSLYSVGSPNAKGGVYTNYFSTTSAPTTTTTAGTTTPIPVYYFNVTVATKTSAHPAYGIGSLLGYKIDGTEGSTLNLVRGTTYIFDQSDASNTNHPLRFSITSNGTNGGGIEYTTGVTTAGTPGNAGAYTQITVANDAPNTLYYYCAYHSGMGGQINITGNITTTTTTTLAPTTTSTTTTSTTTTLAPTTTSTTTTSTTTTPAPTTTSTTTTSTTTTTTTTTTPAPTVFTVTNSSSNFYVINGSNNPTLSLTRGLTYTFNITALSHPFYIKTTEGTGTGNAYSTGITGNGTTNGTLTFVVDAGAPNTLYYNCSVHSGMKGVINITGTTTTTTTPAPTTTTTTTPAPGGGGGYYGY